MEPTFLFHLVFKRVESLAYKFGYFAAAQASHVNMILAKLAFIVVSFAIQVHQVKFVNQSLPLQQSESPIRRAAVDSRVCFLRLAQDLAGVQMLVGRFDYAENGTALTGHAHTALG